MLARSLIASLLALGGCFDGHVEAFRAQSGGAAGQGVAGSPPAPSSGGSGAGGAPAAGAGGAAAGSGNRAGQPFLIDDFEDGDTRALTEGWWYQQNDSTGEQRLEIGIVTDRPSNQRAAHTVGSNFTAWGAILGLDFTGKVTPFDASAYSELRFWARAGTAVMPDITAELLDMTTAHFGRSFQLTTSWREYSLRFADLPHSEGDAARRLDPSRLTAFQVFVLSDQPFDFWVDDVTLVP